MPRVPKKGEIHVRLSRRAYETLQELEEYSGFSGSRLVEEIVLAMDGVMYNFVELALRMEETSSEEDDFAAMLMFFKAMTTILNRVGYSELYEEIEEERKKERKKKSPRSKKESSR